MLVEEATVGLIPHCESPWNSQLSVTLTPRSCYNLERNQRFNSSYEYGSSFTLILNKNQRKNPQG